MTKKRWPKILGVVIVLIGVFIFTAPASLIKDPIAEANLPVQLSGYQGQLLNGKVQTVFIKGLSYQNLSWKLQPLSAISGQFGANLSLLDAKAELDVDVGFKSQEDWQFEGLNGRVELAPITELSRMLSFTKPQGDLVFNDLSSALSNAQFSNSDGTITWQDASVLLNRQRLSLGAITGELSDDGDHLYLDFNGSEGIAPSGQIKLTPAGAFNIEFTIDSEQLPANMSWVNNMGQLDAQGRLAFTLKGQL